jgi:hypothetical protein
MKEEAMCSRARLATGTGAALLLLIMSGCGDQGGGDRKGGESMDPANVTLTRNELTQIGIAFHSFNDATNRGPRNADELAPYLENNTRIVNALKPGGKYIFHWDLSIRQMTQGASNTILAYYKDPVAPGKRLVVMGDAKTQIISEDDFQKKLKAQGK